MLKNYLKTALRNLARNKLYALLNITGLAVGIACCILILSYVHNELSYDRFHVNADRIFRVNSTFILPEQTMYFASTAHVQGPMLKEEYPEVENYVRLTRYGSKRIIEYQERSFEEDRFLWADASLFDVFSFRLIKGDRKEALVKPNSVVVTAEMAEKYFGDEDPLGKSLRVNNEDLYQVTGVMENVPQTSHFRPDFFASFSTLKLEPSGNAGQDMVSNVDYYTYLLLKEGISEEELERKFPAYIEKYLGALLKVLSGEAKLDLQPLTHIYLHSTQANTLEPGSDITYVYLFTGIGLFILLLAGLNFVNLSTARSTTRAKEVGLRKTVGAFRPQLVVQFLGESVILTFLALVLSLGLVFVSLPLFRSISGKELSMAMFLNPVILLGVLGLFLLISLVGGSYPALFLSAFRPVEVLQGKLRKGTKSSILRIILVSFQFTVSIILIIGTLTVGRQLKYIRNKNLGYAKDQVLVLQVRNPETRKQYEAIKREFVQHPGVISVSASATRPLGTDSYSAYHAEGKPQNELSMFFSQRVDEDFFETYQMEIVAGRNFSKDFPTDPDQAIIINEAGVRKMGWQSGPLGKTIDNFETMEKRKPYTIIGVVKDYHFRSLHEEIQPLILFNGNPYGEERNYYLISARISAENIPETIAFLESKWHQFDSRYPFEYEFLDERFDSLYRAEMRLGKLFGYFTVLAILIGCLGLFGLTAFVAEQRTKEIGIRKILGASVRGILLLMIRDFLKWIVLAVAIAWPLGYLLMSNWLQNFAYRINLGVFIFIQAALLAFIIAVLTVIYQVVRASLADPVRALRYE